MAGETGAKVAWEIEVPAESIHDAARTMLDAVLEDDREKADSIYMDLDYPDDSEDFKLRIRGVASAIWRLAREAISKNRRFRRMRILVVMDMVEPKVLPAKYGREGGAKLDA